MKYLRIALLLAGLAMLGGGGYLFVTNYMRTAAVRNWPRVQARITESQVDTLQRQQVGNAGDFMPHVRYDYTVQGRTYHGDILWLDEHRSFGSLNVAARELAFLETGTAVEVLYNPQNPREAALMVDKPTWRFLFLALLGILIARLGWGFWRVAPRPEQPMMPPGMPGQPGMQMQPIKELPPGMQLPQMQIPPGMQVQPEMQPPPQVQVQPPAPAQPAQPSPQFQPILPTGGQFGIVASKPKA